MAAFPDTVRALDPASRADVERALQLNQQNVTELSALDEARLVKLVGQAFAALLGGDGKAFLLCFDQDAAYDSPNFDWFRSRYDRFVYIDRVAVSASARKSGLASQLYSRLSQAAAEAGHDLVCCEVNLDPPNPISDAFHARH